MKESDETNEAFKRLEEKLNNFKRLSEDERKRLLDDWWGKCRTCKYWTGEDSTENGIYHPRWKPGLCTNEKSKLYKEETWTEGYCEEWEEF